MSFLIKFIASTLLRDNLRIKFEHKKQLVTKHVAAWQELAGNRDFVLILSCDKAQKGKQKGREEEENDMQM